MFVFHFQRITESDVAVLLMQVSVFYLSLSPWSLAIKYNLKNKTKPRAMS